MSENKHMLAIDSLAPILKIINPRTTVLGAIHNYKEQSASPEGRDKWDNILGKWSKLGQSASQQLTEAKQIILTLTKDTNLIRTQPFLICTQREADAS